MTDKQDKADEKAAGEAAANPGETVPGGKYLAQDGKTLVNADGEPIGKAK